MNETITKSGFNGQYRFLSNFYPSKIEFETIEYPTVEHAYQAAKSHDPGLRRHISELKTPSEAKRIGRQFALREDWEAVKLPIMKRLLQKKFYDPVLAAALSATGLMELVESNYWHDNFWGSCSCLRESCGKTGQNHLGKLLMEVRQEVNERN